MTKQTNPNLTESFAGLVYDMFRAAGLPINQLNQEKLEKLAPRFAEAVKQEARGAALELAKRLQAATISGFENFAKDLEEKDLKIKELENKIAKLG